MQHSGTKAYAEPQYKGACSVEVQRHMGSAVQRYMQNCSTKVHGVPFVCTVLQYKGTCSTIVIKLPHIANSYSLQPTTNTYNAQAPNSRCSTAVQQLQPPTNNQQLTRTTHRPPTAGAVLQYNHVQWRRAVRDSTWRYMAVHYLN